MTTRNLHAITRVNQRDSQYNRQRDSFENHEGQVQSMVNSQALDTQEAAKKLKTTPNTVRGLIRAGVLHAADISGGKKRPTYRVSPEELERWLAGEKRK